MDKKGWKKKIIAHCEIIGTYQDAFLPVIETLASTLEQRDKTCLLYTSQCNRGPIREPGTAGAPADGKEQPECN